MSSFPLRPVSAGSGRKEFIESMFRRGFIFRRTQSFPRTRRRPDRAAKHHITREQPPVFGAVKWTTDTYKTDTYKMSHDHQLRDRHSGHSVAMFRDKFWLSFTLTIPTLVWSPDVQHWLGFTAPTFPGSRFIPAVLGTIVFVYGGIVFLRGALADLAEHKPRLMTLISLALAVAFATSARATL